MGLHFGNYTASGRGLTTTKRGNCTIRGATRRRQADNQLLMLQNPPVSPAWKPSQSLQTLSAVPTRDGIPAPWNKGGATARENSPYRNHIAPLAGQNSPCSHKMAQFGAFCACRANFLPLPPATCRAGRTLYRMRAGCGASKHNSTPGTAGVKSAGGTRGPGRGAVGRGPGQASRRRAERSSRRGRLAGGPPPTGTHSDQAPLVWRAPEGLAAVPVGGGRAWPGFETTRRAKLAARTARGRAAAHGHNQQPGPAGHAKHPAQQGTQSTRPDSTPAAPQATQHRGADPQARAPSATTQTRTLRSRCVPCRSARAARRSRRSSRSPRLRRRAGPRR